MDLFNPVWAESKQADAHSYTFREPSPTVKAEFRRLFPHIPKELCIALVGTQAQPKMKDVVVKIGGGRTTPVTLVVTPGTEIHFKNTDPFLHRLYGVNVKNFTVGDTQAQGERVWTVPEAGVFEIRDELVPSLRTWIVAEPNAAAFGHPDLAGNFNVELPVAGEFTVQVYFAGKVVGSSATMNITSLQAPIDLSKAPIKLQDKSKAAQDQANEEK
jgi:plastocyanin